MYDVTRVRHLTPTELAARWGGMSVRSLANMRSRGEGPTWMKPTGRILYPLAAIEDYEARFTIKAVA
jgi:hypothetical protein